MMMKILFIFFFALPVFACEPGSSGIIGANYQLKSSELGGISREDFESAIKELIDYYEPLIYREFDRELIIYKNYNSNTVNAYADQSGDNYEITIFGGMAKHQRATKDMVSLVLCHELGHHLGGYPKKAGNTWSSAEGQADYFATSKCLKRLWEKKYNEKLIDWSLVDQTLQNACEQNSNSSLDYFLCLRSNLAGKQMALLFNDLEQNSILPDFATPDPEITTRMVYNHPYAQCRLDTYFQGSLCSASIYQDFDNHDEHIGACTTAGNFAIGLRPKCWFKPR